jgi:hypothetical protein
MGLIHEDKAYGLTIRESATDGSDFTNPDADYRRLFLGEDGQLHVKDSAGTVTDIGAGSGAVATDAIWDAAGDLAVGSGANTAAKLTAGSEDDVLTIVSGVPAWQAPAGGSVPGRQLIAIPVGANTSGGTSLAPTADDAFLAHVLLTGPMKVRGLSFFVNTSAAGALEWGLFDCSSNAAACTKLTGGSAAPGGTGWRTIAATSAPVDVAAGAYILIWKAPAATVPTLAYNNLGTLDGRIARKQASYVWDDTPNITTGWSDSAGPFTMRLVGDIDGSTQFP